MHIRNARISDVPSIIELFQQTVLQTTVRDYNERQREVWAARGNDLDRWNQRIVTQHFLVAEQPNSLVGFGSITAEGYLDVLYVHHAYQGQGIATRLLTALVTWVEQQRLAKITTDASITARPFFARHGYRALTEQQNEMGEEILINYRMQKLL